MKKLLLVALCMVAIPYSYSQSLIFAQLQGQPTINTTGWNLTGAATVGDTPGDGDANNNELILTQATGTSSGGIFYNEMINLGTCTKWTVDFDFRIWGGSGADGIAFCFLDVPPTGFVSGGGVGIPSSANGLKVVFDTYDNGCGANPEIQIFSGVGYTECGGGVVKLNNSGGSLNFIRSNAYNSARVTYDAGNITVIVNGTSYLTASFPISFPGYMGFTASTGGSNDQHSVKNVTIYADIALSDAGPDLNYCTGSTPQIGTSASNSAYTYNWTPSTGLSQTTVSNPTVTTVNNTSAPIVQQYVVQTYVTANLGACPTYDTVLVRINPAFAGSVTQTICQGQSFSFGGTSYTTSGVYPFNFHSVNNCDSIVTLNLTVNPTYNLTRNETICQGSSYTLGGTTYTTSGNYSHTFQTVNGCDSIVNLNLTVNPVFQSTRNEIICQGESYTLGGQQYTATGTYPVSFVTAGGCDSLVTLNLTVRPVFASTRNEVICQGETIQFAGSQYNATGNYPVTLQAVNGCDSVATLNLVVNPVYNITVNETICQGESFTFSGQVYTTAGSYPLSFQTVRGCDSLITFNLTVNPIPAAPLLTTNIPLECPGDLYHCFVNAPVANGSYSWTGPQGFTSDKNILLFNAYENHEGMYAVNVTVNGCTSPSTTTLLDITGTYDIPEFDFPNVITPNGDLINDSLDIDQFISGCVTYELIIWNRWGNLIYEQATGGTPFHGEDKGGNKIADGVYFYRVVYGDQEKSGSLTVIH